MRSVRSRRSARTLRSFLEAHEPWSSAALAHLRQWGVNPWYTRAWWIEGAGGEVQAAVVVSSPCVMRWQAYCALDDPHLARTAAELVDRSPATHLSGFVEHVVPLLPHLSRLHSAGLATLGMSRFPHELRRPLDSRTRLAVPGDLDDLVELFVHFGIGIERTRWQLRSALRRLVRRYPIVVVEDGTRIVAAATMNGLTERYAVVDQLVVDPSARGRGWSWVAASRMQAVLNELGIDAFGVAYATNPMSTDGFEVYEDAWVYAGLFEPRRFRGHARLREQLFRYQALPGNQNPQFRPFKALPYGAAYDPSQSDRPP